MRVALRTQQVIAHESGVANTVDPLGGSYFVERLTDELEAEAYGYFARIDELGGMVAAIEAGYPQREIADAAYRFQRAVDAGERIVVGVNDFRVEEDELAELHRPDPAAEARQRERLERTRAARDAGAVEAALAELRRAAEDPGANLIEPILAAARVRATLGEMVIAMQQVFGAYREQPRF